MFFQNYTSTVFFVHVVSPIPATTKSSTRSRLSEHKSRCRLDQLHKSAITERAFPVNDNSHIEFENTIILSTLSNQINTQITFERKKTFRIQTENNINQSQHNHNQLENDLKKALDSSLTAGKISLVDTGYGSLH